MNQNNPLLCSPETGLCALPDTSSTQSKIAGEAKATKPVHILYFTDPICSSCWGIEPQLRKLKMEYGEAIEIDYRMGGLLPDWSYNSGGISKPSDVAHHWDEVSSYYDMPIDGDLWLEDPLSSSYPPSIAFKAAQMQDPLKAIHFLRTLREMVFLQKKNITKWEHLEQAARNAGLDTRQFKADFEGAAKSKFEEDLALARQQVVRGFPTLFFTNAAGQTEKVYGSKPYSVMEHAVLTVYPKAKKENYARDWQSLFQHYPSLSANEFAQLSNQPRAAAEAQLQELSTQKKLSQLQCKNGSLWLQTTAID